LDSLHFKAENFTVPMINNRVVGYVYIHEDHVSWDAMCVDPLLKHPLKAKVVKHLLSWAKKKLREVGYSDEVIIPVRWEYVTYINFLRKLLKHQ